MSELLEGNTLAPYTPREFVPDGADLGNPDTVAALFHEIAQRELTSRSEVEAFLRHNSELQAAIDQTRAVLYIRMASQTDDEAYAAAFTDFVRTVAPLVKSLSDALSKKYLAAIERFPCAADTYAVYDRALASDVALYRPENVSLETEDELLAQEYQTICGAMTVEFEGDEKTLDQLAAYLEEPDRALRESAWRANTARRLEDADRLDGILDEMIEIRTRIARNAGFGSFLEYQFRALHRFDYTPADCVQYHGTVADCVAPLLASQLRERASDLGLDTLRPWDTAVDPEGRAPLAPFANAREFAERTEAIFRATDPALGDQFAAMADQGLLDLANRKGKAPGGFQETLAEARKPFIFMNAVGIDNDVQTLLHEGGHAFHALASADQPILAYRHAPIEFCEVASFGMELLAGEHLSPFYTEEEIRRSRRAFFRDKITLLAWVATVDAYQHWLYTHPGHSHDERHSQWMAIHNRFNGAVIDWSGFEEEQSLLWQRQLHIFEVPFYYIEYGIAQLGAFQLWLRAKANPSEALRLYKSALALGGSRPLPALFQEAGIAFDFSEKMIVPILEAVSDELAAG
jgi:oligoendopeptidase F